MFSLNCDRAFSDSGATLGFVALLHNASREFIFAFTHKLDHYSSLEESFGISIKEFVKPKGKDCVTLGLDLIALQQLIH